tara:strand:+ start:844 stop:1329 length:486 start_codon:yes stop_codon:yes gene_type:complete
MSTKRRHKKIEVNGYRSGLEHLVSKQIRHARNKIRYEAMKIQWVDFSVRSYTPDFILDNGIILEVKGFWDTADRRKHVEIKRQHENLDIRFVFENSRKKIRKGSKTSYGDWCEKNNILFCDRVVPKMWLQEKLIQMPSKIVQVPIENNLIMIEEKFHAEST